LVVVAEAVEVVESPVGDLCAVVGDYVHLAAFFE
jgi:hypothetical protein